jgi:hypothetical protein
MQLVVVNAVAAAVMTFACVRLEYISGFIT